MGRRVGDVKVGFGRIADCELWPTEPARIFDGEIVNSKVNAVGSDGQGDVDPIIDNHRNAVRFANPKHSPRQVRKLSVRGGFAAELNARGTATDRRPNAIDKITRRDVGIGHEVEAQSLNRNLHHRRTAMASVISMGRGVA